jgi:hypothetical protein
LKQPHFYTWIDIDVGRTCLVGVLVGLVGREKNSEARTQGPTKVSLPAAANRSSNIDIRLQIVPRQHTRAGPAEVNPKYLVQVSNADTYRPSTVLRKLLRKLLREWQAERQTALPRH